MNTRKLAIVTILLVVIGSILLTGCSKFEKGDVAQTTNDVFLYDEYGNFRCMIGAGSNVIVSDDFLEPYGSSMNIEKATIELPTDPKCHGNVDVSVLDSIN